MLETLYTFRFFFLTFVWPIVTFYPFHSSWLWNGFNWACIIMV